jgi:hypothetical protein
MTDLVVAIATVAYVALTAAVVLFMWLQTKAQRKTLQMQAFDMLAAKLEEGRQQRRVVRDYARDSKARSGKVVFPLPNEVMDAVDRICRDFDYLGLFDRTGLVDSRLVDMFYSVPFVLLYEDILGEYVAELRKQENRGPTHLWELVKFYERVRAVPKNHPGVTGNANWSSHSPRFVRDDAN